ncbi:uncharacterized protein TA06355 [Theileria annulata]|uniref:Uncharacterized protein n=1 Tax=Theileria annulata TaxID=5874 RepID=Q4UIA4_THEAN|nr:uncharacterized protein TA06355 [Theileria annulata]CAI73185.1 hypothetical protein TA06355 [Theileria annulata]|eukprot:XP_953863.1 hypothetical protein TA06355 [Theileria annulata]
MKVWVKFVVLVFLRLVPVYCNFSQVKLTLHRMFKNKDFGESLDQLVNNYKYTTESIENSFRRCLENEMDDNKIMACFISGLYRERVLEQHKLLLCIAEYAKNAAMNCIIACLNNYTPECFKVTYF